MIVEIEIPEGAEPQYRAAARQIREWARGDQRADAARAVADALIEQIPPRCGATAELSEAQYRLLCQLGRGHDGAHQDALDIEDYGAEAVVTWPVS